MNGFVAVDAFSGAGGLSYGLSQAGWRIATAFDHDPIAIATYRRNLGSHGVVADAMYLSGEALMKLAGLGAGECDLLAGGPPCQGFSLQRRGTRSDPRNGLSLIFIEWVRALRPKAFLIENVPAIGSVRGREVMDSVRRLSRELSYGLSIHTVNAVDFGVAQNRRRTFIVGMSGNRLYRWSRSSDRHLTVRDAIGDLPSPPLDGSCHPQVPNHYREGRMSATNLARIRAIPEGGSRVDLPDDLQLECHKHGHRHLDTYGRLSWDQPAVTITARFDSFTRGRFGHPVEDRSVTLREGARLQGFPDRFHFLGNREEGARMIGNAVAPPVARAFGMQLAEQLRQEQSLAA